MFHRLLIYDAVFVGLYPLLIVYFKFAVISDIVMVVRK